MKSLARALLVACLPLMSQAQDLRGLMKRLREKMDVVNDYKASGSLKTDVAFLKIPVSRVNVLYMKPDRFRIRKEGGVSLLPKGGVSVNLNSLITSGDATPIASGEAVVGRTPVKVVKLLPADEGGEVILSTLYIDEKELLIRKAVTTTRENGTYTMEMDYGRYARYGLPDKVVVTFNTKDYKLPKGITFEYESGEKPVKPADAGKEGKGRVEITYDSYQINPGLTAAAFK
jgi:hypothetical protein